jgi:uncharacterized membrane protein YkvA (DUF1232 family)
MFARLRKWARKVKQDVVAIWLAGHDPRVPLHAKVLAMCVAGYALSPIDLIPDFIPVIGYLDDAVIVPLGILLVVRLIPKDIMAEHRATATQLSQRPSATNAAFVIVMIWIIATAFCGWVAYCLFR